MRERKKSSAEAGTESPQGTFGNSPPFQRRESVDRRSSPRRGRLNTVFYNSNHVPPRGKSPGALCFLRERTPGPTRSALSLSVTTHEGAPSFAAKLVLFFLSFTAKGGITITVHTQEIALVSRSW